MFKTFVTCGQWQVMLDILGSALLSGAFVSGPVWAAWGVHAHLCGQAAPAWLQGALGGRAALPQVQWQQRRALLLCPDKSWALNMSWVTPKGSFQHGMRLETSFNQLTKGQWSSSSCFPRRNLPLIPFLVNKPTPACLKGSTVSFERGHPMASSVGNCHSSFSVKWCALLKHPHAISVCVPVFSLAPWWCLLLLPLPNLCAEVPGGISSALHAKNQNRKLSGNTVLMDRMFTGYV